MNNIKNTLRRSSALLSALVIAAVALMPVLNISKVGAFTGAQATSRNVTMSDSAVSDTGVSYKVAFNPTVTTTIGGIVVDFCGNSPTVGLNSCTLPTGFTLGTTVTASVTSGFSTSTGTWVTTSSLQGAAAASNFQVMKLTNTTAQTPTGTGTPIVVTITGVTNPSALGTFYVRILTFDTSANAVSQYTASTSTRATTFANGIDYGGAAISTANQIGITAIVQETLQFCVSGASMGSACSGMTTPSLALGTGTPVVLGTALSTAPAYTQTSTNAQSGVSIRMTNSNTTCGGLSSNGGTTCSITAVGATPAAIAASSGKFGMYVTAGSGNTSAVSPYNGGTTNYGMDITTSNNNVISTYGSQIVTSTGALANENDTLTFGAAAAPTTPAGIYTATMTLICTGTF